VVVGPIPGDDVVGSFMDVDGGTVSLVRAIGAAWSRGRPATLEEVVLGHLAAGRAPRRLEVAA
jgi:hypothetical protein